LINVCCVGLFYHQTKLLAGFNHGTRMTLIERISTDFFFLGLSAIYPLTLDRPDRFYKPVRSNSSILYWLKRVA